MEDPPGAPKPARQSSTSLLDAITVSGSLIIIGGVLFGLFVTTVPSPQLPVIASLAGLIGGTVLGGYAGYKWGASEALKKVADMGGAK